MEEQNTEDKARGAYYSAFDRERHTTVPEGLLLKLSGQQDKEDKRTKFFQAVEIWKSMDVDGWIAMTSWNRLRSEIGSIGWLSHEDMHPLSPSPLESTKLLLDAQPVFPDAKDMIVWLMHDWPVEKSKPSKLPRKQKKKYIKRFGRLDYRRACSSHHFKSFKPW